MQFAVTMCVSLCISAFNALTLSPALCALILRPAGPAVQKKIFLFRWFDLSLNRTKKGYIGFSKIHDPPFLPDGDPDRRGARGERLPAPELKGGFLPKRGQGRADVRTELPPGAALARTEAAMKVFSQEVLAIPGVKDMITVAGYSIMSVRAKISASRS
jgi:multidrug efflux pump subunit AcrB